MSTEVGAIHVRIGASLDDFEAEVGRAIKSVEGIADKMKDAGRQIQAVGKSWSLYLTAPITGFGALALRSAGQFESAMNNVAAVSGAVGDQLGRLEEQAKQLGATTQFSASQAADAMGFLAMAGFEAEQIMAAMPSTLQLAAAAQMNLAQAADITSNILTGYGKSVEELGHVNDVLVKAFTSANTNLQQLGEALKFAGPVASAAGVEFEEAAAALALMGNAGIQASMAGTSLRGAISRLLNPTDTMGNALSKMGVDVVDASGRLKSLDEIIRALEPHVEDAGMFMELFGQRAGPAMAALVSQGGDALADLRSELIASGGTAERIADVQMQGFNGAMRELASAFEAVQIAIAESGLMEFAAELATKLADLLRWVASLNPEILKWGTVIAAVVAAIGPLLIAIGTLTIGLGMLMPAIAAVGAALTVLTGPVGLVVAAVAALTFAWVKWGDEITEIVTNVTAFVVETFTGFAEAVRAIWQGMVDMITGVFGGAMDRVVELTTGVTERVAEAWQWLSDTLIGNSIIPDMHAAIEDEFIRHGQVVAGITDDTASQIERSYERAARNSTASLSKMSNEALGLLGQLFEGSKEIATAQAIVNAYEGISKTLATYPWPIAGALAALHGAVAFKQVAAIQSTGKGSKGGGGMAGGAAAGSSAATMAGMGGGMQQRQVITLEGIDRNALFSGDQIVALLREAQEFGAIIEVAA